jgi:hypothetical protein
MQFEPSTNRQHTDKLPKLSAVGQPRNNLLAAEIHLAQSRLYIERAITEAHDLLELRKLHDLTEDLHHHVVVLQQIEDTRRSSQCAEGMTGLFGIFEE